MLKEIIAKFFSSRGFYIIFSVLVAFLLWLYVEIGINQEVETTVIAPIEFINEDVLRDRNLFASSYSPQTVRFVFTTPRNIARTLNTEGVSIAVDLAAVNASGNFRLPYIMRFPDGLDINPTSRSTESITLIVDRLVTKTIPVRAVYTGGTASEYFISDPVQMSPEVVEIRGPETVLAQVYSAWVPIIRENLSTTFTDDLPFILLDAEGEEIEQYLYDQIEVNTDTIRITVPIRMQREVVLRVNLFEGAGATAANALVSIDPETITVAGDPEALAYYNTILLRTIDLSAFETSETFTFPIPLDNDFTNISGETEATVTVELVGLEIRHLSVGAASFHVTNVPPGLVAEIRTQNVDVRIRGRAAHIEDIEPHNIRVVATLADDVGLGTIRVPARVYIDGFGGNIGAVGSYILTVNISDVDEVEE